MAPKTAPTPVQAARKVTKASKEINFSSYILFCKAKRPELKEQHPNATFGEIRKLLGELWQQLEKNAKSPTLVEYASSSNVNSKVMKPNEDWAGYFRNRIQMSKKLDFTVSYFMTGEITQADRNYVAKVMEYYSTRGKRDACPCVDVVTNDLSDDMQGVTTNRDINHALKRLFRTPKHINAMFDYFQQTCAKFNDIVVHISVDRSPFFATARN